MRVLLSCSELTLQLSIHRPSWLARHNSLGPLGTAPCHPRPAESIAGGSQDALLCLKRPANHWGDWENYDKLVPLLVQRERQRDLRQRRQQHHDRDCERSFFHADEVAAELPGPSNDTSPLSIEVFFAADDKLTNGRKGASWFDNCWTHEKCQGYITYRSEVVEGQTHESLIDPDKIGGPIEKVFMRVARLWSERSSASE